VKRHERHSYTGHIAQSSSWQHSFPVVYVVARVGLVRRLLCSFGCIFFRLWWRFIREEMRMQFLFWWRLSGLVFITTLSHTDCLFTFWRPYSDFMDMLHPFLNSSIIIIIIIVKFLNELKARFWSRLYLTWAILTTAPLCLVFMWTPWCFRPWHSTNSL